MAETISMPKLGFDMSEGTLIRWVKNEGEQIKKGDVLAEIETDKATVEVESSASGIVRKLLAGQGEVVPVGAPIAIVGSADEKIADVAPAAGTQAQPAKTAAPGAALPRAPERGQVAPVPVPAPTPLAGPATGPVKASPLAKKMARDAKVDLARLRGTGPGGRIVRKDVEAAAVGGALQAPAAATAAQFASVPIGARADETVQPSRLRQAIARRMTESKATAPHFYVTHEFKLDALLGVRSQLNDYLPENEKLSVNDFIVKAVALALRAFPNLNASFAGEQVIRHGAVNVSVAVAVENGLLTVVNRYADQKPVRQIASELKEMVARARTGKVRPDDIEGSTFSVSNLGMYDVENFIAILNPPEAAILAVGSARELPVVEDGQIQAGWRMKATISVDHRVSDGAEAARFMQTLASFLENPARILI